MAKNEDKDTRRIVIELWEFNDYIGEIVPYSDVSPEAVIRSLFADLNGLYSMCEATAKGYEKDATRITNTIEYIVSAAKYELSKDAIRDIVEQTNKILITMLRRIRRIGNWSEFYFEPHDINLGPKDMGYRGLTLTILCKPVRTHTKEAARLFSVLARTILLNFAEFDVPYEKSSRRLRDVRKSPRRRK